jgi:murein DD-endopeptidase MepM/ murein hydrolase activator NlpD
MKLLKNLQLLFWASIVLIGLCLGGVYYSRTQEPLLLTDKDAPSTPLVSIEEEYPYVIVPRATLFSILSELDVPGQTIQQIVEAAKPIQNLAKLKPGIRFQLTYEDGETRQLSAIHFRFSAIESMNVKRMLGGWNAEKITEKVDIKVVTYSGKVTSSLWESAQRAKMDPNLIAELADIFGWEVDFAREVRVNDRWRLTVEQKLVKGQPIGWGAILAAEYDNAGVPFKAALYRLNGEEMGYFTPEGASLRKMFLKSPIRYGRITSGFSKRRFHPILQIVRPHLGVDYGAPVGTPVRAVGDGTVIMAGMNGGAGNMVKIRHNGTYQTAYKHLKGFASGVRAGAHVQQGQVIAYVGTTGLSTGPHLHFEFYQSGVYVDPVSKKFPSSDPVPKDHLEQFKAESAVLISALPAWESADTNTAELSSEDENKKN